MTRFVISGRVGAADAFEPRLAENERLAVVDLRVGTTTELAFGIGKILKEAVKLQLAPTGVGIDLLVLAALVYTADTRVSRRDGTQDQWTRELRLVVPVSNADLWSNSAALLERTLAFLTGDIWTIEFRPLPSPHRIPVAGALAGPAPFDCISLFSGGLDSLIGAIDVIEKKEQRPLFVSHGGASDVSGPQGKLFESLLGHYPARKNDIKRVRLGLTPPSRIFQDVRSEPSTRGRSFLFFALATMLGSGLGRPFDLWVPENGLISLNVPLDVTRLGSNSTRTTHPFYIHRWNELVRALGIPGHLKNPYWDKTKGQMVANCRNSAVLEALHAGSISCAHPDTSRWDRSPHKHCGVCLPCIIRRASLLNPPWQGGDRTGYRLDDLRERPLHAGMRSEGEQIRGFQFALLRLNGRRDVARSLIYKPGPLSEDAAIVPDLVDVYVNGMAEVDTLLRNVVTIP